MIENHLNGIQYTDFVEGRLPPLVEDVPYNVHVGVQIQHDGTIPHFSHQVCNWLNNCFADM
jgi:hypothetical protein